MLGSVADAEDVLQEAFLRWQRASEADIRSPRAFLVTIVSRLCINHLESARVQRESYVGEWLPEPLVTEPGSDASRVVQVDESVSMALLLLLERLTPARTGGLPAARGLRLQARRDRGGARSDRGQLPAAPAARPAGRPPDASALPAARRGATGAARALPPGGRLRRHGPAGLPALQRRRDAHRRRRPGVGPPASDLRTGQGRDRRACTAFRRLLSLDVQQRFVEINGQPGIVSYQDGRPQSVFTVEVADGRIEAIYIVTNPEKLSRLPSLAA